MRTLDRYVLRQFLIIFFVCVIGVPLIFTVIHLTDHLEIYLSQGVAKQNVMLSYIYQFPYQSLLAFPVAALLATVFTVANMSRHSEITAAKAGGISFYRLSLPLLVAGLAVSLLALSLTEVIPRANRLSKQALGKELERIKTTRTGFVYAGSDGRVYKVRNLDAAQGRIADLQIEREGTGPEYPTYVVIADEALYDSANGDWTIREGRLRILPTSQATFTFVFDELFIRSFRETPDDLLAEAKEPDDMNFRELGEHIEVIERAGGTALELEVERALKVAYPFACLVIVLFGTPLAYTSRRGGAPLSIGIALAVTIIYLILIRIAQALGGSGVVPPTVAAWIPNFVFVMLGLGLYSRVRT